MKCEFCKEILEKDQKIYPKYKGERLVIFHQQCYEYLVMNNGTPLAQDMFWDMKDKIILYREDLPEKYGDYFKRR